MVSPPAWLQELANAIAALMTPVEVLSPIGCHFCFVEKHWEITLFASDTEIVGGQKDGGQRPSRFSLDLKRVVELFGSVSSLRWQALPLGPQDELGAHFSLEGEFEGQPVWLRVLAKSPRRFDAGRKAHVYELSWEETW